MSVLALDAGTTGVTALVVGDDGTLQGRGYQEFPQHFPRPGEVEHDPEQIWQAVLSACRQALDASPDAGVRAVGLTNQRETAVLWDRATLAAPRRAIVWQDRRTGDICRRLADTGVEPRVAELTGLRLDPYFTATKLTWLAENDPATWAGVRAGAVAVGTVDSYLVARLTGGRRHVTEPTNASRTLLYDLAAADWSGELCELFGVPQQALPELVPSAGVLAETDPEAFLGLRVPVAGIAGDQQAALFGQGCYQPGQSKCTYGTGSFVLVNTGGDLVRSPRLLTTVAWDLGDGPVYALEGSIFVTGAAVQWLRDGLGVIDRAPEIEGLARSVPDSGGVVFVPALTGLGAPDWDADARGTILGITRGTTRAHLARATLEAIAFEVRDVVDAMTAEAGLDIPELAVDGGASGNDLLCQLQADQLGVAVRRPAVTETTGLGAALLAGLGSGVWSSTAELAGLHPDFSRFDPTPGARNDGRHERWRRGVKRASGWDSAPAAGGTGSAASGGRPTS